MFNRKQSTDFIPDLYQLCTMKVPESLRLEKVAEWLGKNVTKVSNSTIKRTFVIAGREDLVDKMLLEVVDIDLHDTVRSRQTGRVGKVIGIHGDGETIVVSWDTGGQQLLSKGNVIKLNSATDFNNYKKVQTEADEYSKGEEHGK